MNLTNRITRFYIEFQQGASTPQKLLQKYNLVDILFVEGNDIVTTSLDGMKVLERMKNLDPKDIVRNKKRLNNPEIGT